jgi:hypothetical protein
VGGIWSSLLERGRVTGVLGLIRAVALRENMRDVRASKEIIERVGRARGAAKIRVAAHSVN